MRIGFQTLNLIKPLKLNRLQAFSANNATSPFAPLKADTFERTNPIAFKGITCSTSMFEIADVENLHCPICEKLMLDDGQIKAFVSNVKDKKGEDLVEALDTFGLESYWTHDKSSKDKTIYSSKRGQIVKIIKNIAKENPELDLSQIVKLVARNCALDLSNKELSVLGELHGYVSDNVKNPHEKCKLLSQIKQGMEQSKLVGEEAFKRKKFLYAIKDASSNPAIQKEIDEIAQKLPTSINDIDAFFVKYSKENRKNAEIARSLISGNKPTAEHLICQSDGGGDYLENYLCDCMECNSNRMSTPFDEWIETIPQAQQKLQKHLDTIQGLIDEGRFSSDYDFYVLGVAKTISKLSNGKIKIKTMQKGDSQFENIAKRRQKQKQQLTKEIEIMELELQENREAFDNLKLIIKKSSSNNVDIFIGEAKKKMAVCRKRMDVLNNKINEANKELKILNGYDKKYSIA